jgi:hypothetical protein
MGGPGSGRKKGSGKSGQRFTAGSSKGSRARVAATRAEGAKKLKAAGYKTGTKRAKKISE